MSVLYSRIGGVVGLLGLYLLSPVLGVVVLVAGYTYALLSERAQQAEGDGPITLNLGGAR